MSTFIFHQEQQYVRDIADTRGIPLEVIYHDRPTQTSLDKAGLLGWPLERVITAVYFSSGSSRVGVVRPASPVRLATKSLLSRVLGISGKEAGRYSLNGGVPEGMSAGTCTPFPRERLVGSGAGIDKLVIVRDDDLDHQMVDVSVGTYDGDISRDSSQMSLHLPYAGLRQILLAKFGEGLVTLVSFDEATRHDVK